MTEATLVQMIDDWRDVPMDMVFMIVDAPDLMNMQWKLQQHKAVVPKMVFKERFKDRYWVPVNEIDHEE